MKKIFVFLSILIFLMLTCKADEIQRQGNLGYLTDGLDDFKQKDMRLAFHLWVDELSKEQNVVATIKYYDTDTEIIKAYDNFEVNHISMNSYLFLKNFDQIQQYSSNYWMIQKSDTLFEDMLFLVRTDSGIKSMKDLKNKIVVTKSDNYMGKMDLDYEILKEMHTSADGYIGSYFLTNQFSTSILKTYFCKADLCIVPRYAYNTVVEMNPDVGKKLKVLHVSPNTYVMMLGAFNNRTDPLLVELYRKNVEEMPDTVRGKTILDMFKVRKILPVDISTLRPLLNYYHDYVELQKKYGHKL